MPPSIPINFLAVVVAAVANMVIGFLWFGPLFGKKWMALTGMSMEKMNKGQTNMAVTYVLAFVSSLVMSFVLAHSIVFASSYLNVTGVMAGVQAGFWNWLGFMMPVTLSTVLWEMKSWSLWVLSSAYYLVALIIMGVILAVWQ